jgi:hypothetical protein
VIVTLQENDGEGEETVGVRREMGGRKGSFSIGKY